MATSSRKQPPVRARRPGTVGQFTRIAIQASKHDAGLIRSLARALRGDGERATVLRATLARALAGPAIETAFDVFGSDLPDEAFAGVFDPVRSEG